MSFAIHRPNILRKEYECDDPLNVLDKTIQITGHFDSLIHAKYINSNKTEAAVLL
jgi:hypothetical protein